MCVCLCVRRECVCERERVCAFVFECVCERMRVCVCERERKSVVCVRERECVVCGCVPFTPSQPVR